MSPHWASAEVGIIVAKTLTLFLGGLITYFSWKAYRRTKAPSLRALALGFGIMTMGLVVAGIGNIVFDVPTLFSVFFESILTTLALAVIVYSLYVQ